MKRMKSYYRYLVLLLLSAVSCVSGYTQQTESAYRFEGDQVVFEFDVRLYAKELLGENALKLDFADLGVYEVAVTGEFNNWNKKGWRMEKKDEFTFVLRKAIQEFNDAFPIDFKFIINGRFLASPEGDVTDPRQFKDDFIEDIYKLDLSLLTIAADGNVLFRLDGYTSRSQVILTGSFNGWNEQAIKMNKTATGWELRGNLPPGRYEYKFIADGEWLHDPKAKENIKNEHNTLNSVLMVTVPTVFELYGHADAKKVILAGSFNNWNEQKELMHLVNGVWKSTLPLTGGKHSYKFIVDGIWYTDPGNPLKEDDGYGNINSVLFVH
jgi:hypothetical protein